jgi:polyene glycosyltransferase
VDPAPDKPVLFASAAHPGQANPLLAIAGELSRRDVPDLWFASEEVARKQVAEVSTGSQVSFLTSGETRLYADDSRYAAMTRGPRTTDGLVALVRLIRHPDVVAEQYPWMLAQVDAVRPRLMVIDALHFPALDAAMTRRVPFLLSVPFPVSGLFGARLPWRYPAPTSGLPYRMSPRQQLANVLFRLRLQAAMLTRTDLVRSVRQRRALGIANVAGDPARYASAAAAVLGYSVFGLEYPFAAPPHLRMLGPVLPPAHTGTDGASDLPAWLDRHESVVYVGLGTMATLSRDQLSALAQALSTLSPDHRVLWKLPAAQQALLDHPLPAHVRVQEWVPSQVEVLAHPHVRVFVTHGGANGLHEGIYFGKALLVMPLWMDCYDLAVRAVDAGVGLALDHPPLIAAHEVASKLRRLLSDDTFRTRSQHWGEQLRAAGGLGRAADVILEHLDRSALLRGRN